MDGGRCRDRGFDRYGESVTYDATGLEPLGVIHALDVKLDGTSVAENERQLTIADLVLDTPAADGVAVYLDPFAAGIAVIKLLEKNLGASIAGQLGSRGDE